MEQEDKPCLHCSIQAKADSIGHVCLPPPPAPLFRSLSGESWCGVLPGSSHLIQNRTLMKTPGIGTWLSHSAIRVLCNRTPVFLEMPPTAGETSMPSQSPFLTPAGCCGLRCAELRKGKRSWRTGPGGKVRLRNRRIENFPGHLCLLLL